MVPPLVWLAVRGLGWPLTRTGEAMIEGRIKLQGDWLAVTHERIVNDAVALWRVYVTGPDVPLQWMDKLVAIKRGMHFPTTVEHGVEVYYFRKGDVIGLEEA